MAGAIVCEVFGIAAITILSTAWLGSQAAMFSALALLVPAAWLLVGAELARSMPLLLFAAALCGVAGGLGYRGSLEVINRIAPADQRSEVVSSYLIALFAGNSLPVIGIGLLSAAAGSHRRPCHVRRGDHRACGNRRFDRRQIRAGYLIASGLVGEPTAPVMGIAGATNMNS